MRKDNIIEDYTSNQLRIGLSMLEKKYTCTDIQSNYFNSMLKNLTSDFEPILKEKLSKYNVEIIFCKNINGDNYELVIKKNSYLIALFKVIDVNDTFELPELSNPLLDSSIEPLIFFFKDKDFFKKLSNNLNEKLTLEKVINLIINKLQEIKEKYLSSGIISEIIAHVKEMSNINQINLDIQSFIQNNLNKEAITVNDSLDFEFADDSDDGFENKLHELMLKKPNIDEEVGRYMSLDSFYRTIRDRKIYFGSVIGMNDKSETKYYASKVYYDTAYLEKYHDLEIKNVNESFITSYVKSDKIDNLTLWRMYGDNGRGICMVFKTLQEKNSFKLREINYCTEYGSHLVLGLLHSFVYAIKNSRFCDVRDTSTFKFNKSYVWKHFFKAKEYIDENEVRLLYRFEKDIIKETQNTIEMNWRVINNIIVPSILIPFDYEGLPLKLTKIYIGPKAIERETNLKQIKHFLESQGFTDVEVCVSTIDNYR